MASQLPTVLIQYLEQAVQVQASDMHLEATQVGYQIRLRQQGQLTPLTTLSKQQGLQWVAALKNAAGVDVTQKRRAQDGRFQLYEAQLQLDCRFNSIPTFWGEKIALRLFNRQEQVLRLDALGLHPEQKQLILQVLAQKEGLVLVVGPTGSGKTRTLYAMLEHLNQPELNISTVEDPIEIPFNGINQTAVEPHIGWGFAECLRALLRQDPDVLMIGEIRDSETALIATQAAQTGHLVLATLHAKHALGALTRLIQLGIDHRQLCNTLSLIINQRLIQKDGQRTGHFELCYLGQQQQQRLLEAKQLADFWQSAIEVLQPC